MSRVAFLKQEDMHELKSGIAMIQFGYEAAQNIFRNQFQFSRVPPTVAARELNEARSGSTPLSDERR